MSVYYLMSQSDRNRGIQFYTFKKQTGRVDHTWVSLPAVFLSILSLFCFSLIFSLTHLAVPRRTSSSFYPSQFTVAHMHKLLQK